MTNTQNKGTKKIHHIQRPVGNIIQFIERFPDQITCIKYLEGKRWNNEPACPHCGTTKYYEYKDGVRYKCVGCREIYNVKVGTIFEGSKIPLQKWFLAIYISSSHKKGISSCQLARDLNITQKSAWFMLHRIRTMMKDTSNDLLKGIIEIDGTLIGGKLKYKKWRAIEKLKKQYNTDRLGGNVGKTPLLGVMERDGKLKLILTEETDRGALTPILLQLIDKSARIFTDTFGGYSLLKFYFAEHAKVNHTKGEYTRGEVHNNGVEAVWNHIKRTILGTYHYVSPKHLSRYCYEMELRYNTRKYQSEFMRFEDVIMGSEGRRLKYYELIEEKNKAA